MNGSSHPKHENTQKNVLARILALLMGATRTTGARAMVKGLRMRLCPLWRACRTLGQRNPAECFHLENLPEITD